MVTTREYVYDYYCVFRIVLIAKLEDGTVWYRTGITRCVVSAGRSVPVGEREG